MVPVKLFAAGRRGMPNAGDAAIDRVVLERGEEQDVIEQGDGRYVALWTRTEWFTYFGWDCEPGRIVEVEMRPVRALALTGTTTGGA